MTPEEEILARSEELARQLPAHRMGTPSSATTLPGTAGRRRAGQGEHFWQYRRFTQEDSARSIDWRRSARGHELYVRESELETTRTAYFWADGSPGFRWKAAGEQRTKAEEAIILMLSMAILISGEGEHMAPLITDARAGMGRPALERLTTALLNSSDERPAFPRADASLIVLASDFYEPATIWEERLVPLVRKCRKGILLAVCSATERNFPFHGRTRLSCPQSERQHLLGRAETVREEYLRRFEAQRRSIAQMATGLGWEMITHVTGDPLLPAAARLMAAVEQARA